MAERAKHSKDDRDNAAMSDSKGRLRDRQSFPEAEAAARKAAEDKAAADARDKG